MPKYNIVSKINDDSMLIVTVICVTLDHRYFFIYLWKGKCVICAIFYVWQIYFALHFGEFCSFCIGVNERSLGEA